MPQVILTEKDTEAWFEFQQKKRALKIKVEELRIDKIRYMVPALQNEITKRDGCVLNVINAPERDYCEGCLLFEEKVPDNRYSLCAFYRIR